MLNIRILCEANKMTIAEIAKIAGIKSTTTMLNRNDKPGNWTLGQLTHIAAYFGKPLEWLFEDHV